MGKIIADKISKKLKRNNRSFTKDVRSSLSYLQFLRAFRLIFVIILVLIISQTKFVSANFVCGQAEDSDDNMAASWYSVRIFYPSAPDKFAGCQVSPAENKYCCDVEAIPGKSWKIGDVVAAEIFDNESGYVAGPVSLVTSGEGFDVFPIMQLEKAIKIYNLSKVLFSNESVFFLNASFNQDYFVELENGNNKSVLCLNCSRIEQNINVEFGMNYLKLIASYENRSFSENIVFALLNSYSFERKIECGGCRENVVRRNSVVNMSLFLNLSHEIENLELREYVPIGWEILGTDGKVENYSETHNLIIWNVSGKNIEKKYLARAPRIFLFPRKYVFRTELEDKLINESEIIASRFFRFFSFDENIALKDLEARKVEKFSVVAPNMPLVKRFDNKSIMRIAVFPDEVIKNAEFDLEDCIAEEISADIIDCYLFRANFNGEIEKIFLEFKAEKGVLENYENISLYSFDERKGWKEAEIEVFEEDETYFYYRTFLKPCGGMAITGKNKNTLFGNIIKAFS